MGTFLRRGLLLCLSGLALLVAPAAADVLHLADGREIEGEIVSESAREVVIRTRFGELTFPRKEVTRVERGPTVEQQFDARWKTCGSAGAFFELGEWADSKRRRPLAKKSMRKVLELDPDHEGARTFLGFVRHAGEWMTPEERDERKRADEEAEMAAKGLVRHGDDWVSSEAKSKLEQGLILHDGRWMSPEEAMRARGFVQWRGEWIPGGQGVALQEAAAALGQSGDLGVTVTTDNVAIVGPFAPALAQEIADGLDRGRSWFDQRLGSAAGLELLGGRVATFYVFDRQASERFEESVAPIVAATHTLPATFPEFARSLHGYYFVDPHCVSVARVWGRPDEHMAGHCYHHWGHLLLGRLGYDGRLLPPWYEEGFASYFEFAQHARNDVLCIGGDETSHGRTTVRQRERRFETRDFRRGIWREVLKGQLAAGSVASFDHLARKDTGSLEMLDIACGMAVCEWLLSQPDALPRFHAVLRERAPKAPLRSPPEAAERQALYDAAFGAAAGMGWREADRAWRAWFEAREAASDGR